MKTNARRGFAAMDPAKQRELASRGGKAAQQNGTGNRWNAETAAAAGKKGGEAISKDRAYMSDIGRKGGERAKTRRVSP